MKIFKTVVLSAFLFVAMYAIGFCDIDWSSVNYPIVKFMAKYYDVEPITVVSVGQRMEKYDDDTSVLLYLANNASVDPFEILEKRIEGKTWVELFKKYKVKLTPLFLEAGNNIPERFRYAYAQYAAHKKNPNYKMKLYDTNIRDLVQLNLLKKAFNLEPRNVMKSVNNGASFAELIEQQLDKHEFQYEPEPKLEDTDIE